MADDHWVFSEGSAGLFFERGKELCLRHGMPLVFSRQLERRSQRGGSKCHVVTPEGKVDVSRGFQQRRGSCEGTS